MAIDPQPQPTALERAVLLAERRVVRKRAWYRHQAVWGVCGVAVGFLAGFASHRFAEPSRALAASTPPVARSFSAPQRLVQKEPESAPVTRKEPEEKPTNILREQRPEPIREIAIPADLPILPGVTGTIEGPPPEIRVQPFKVAPIKPKASPKPEQVSANTAAIQELSQRIANLRQQRLDLLKSFYEDAIPVKHLDEDLAAAEAELKRLQSPTK